MERSRRPRVDGLQEETEQYGLPSQGSSFNNHGFANQFNAPSGTINNSTGPGNHPTGSTFHGPVYFGTQEHFDPSRDCLRSLAFLEMDGRFLDIDAAAKGTCNWLLWHQTFKSWASCGRGLLWIKGKPGSGKSTLLRYVLDHIVTIPNTGEGALILLFFFHGRGTELQRTPLGLFRSLLHQLLRQVPEALTDLVDTFQQRCETVDESGQKNAVRLVREFKSLVQGLPSTGSQFHICFTCRHYPILDQACQFEICLEEENEQDISTYVRTQLSVSRELTTSTIPKLITKHAQGVFIWAYLVVDRILDLDNGGAGLRKIEDEIYSIPPDLDDLYHDLIRNMDERPASLKLIQWICFAVRPLSLDELRWAMIVDADCLHKSLQECKNTEDYISDSNRMKRRIQTLSRGLAEVISDAKIVQFIHQSVKDFFIEKGLSALDGAPNPNFIGGIAHRRLSRTCICYLAMEEIGRSASHEPDPLKSEFPLLHYATTSWVAHTKQSDARSVPQEDLLKYFAWPSNTLIEQWVRIYRILERYSDACPPEGTSLVHVMSRFAWPNATIVGRLGGGGGGGDETIVQLLLDRGANADAVDKEGQMLLSWAAARGHEAVVRLLLDRGAYSEAADKEDRTPLSWAAAKGHEVVVRLLLDRGANADAVDNEGQTPLSYAAVKGHEVVVGLLLDRGVYTNAADKEGRTSLLLAAENGHEAVVRLLLDRGAHSEAADKEGRTPLSWAAACTTRIDLGSRVWYIDYHPNHALRDYRMQLMLLEQSNKARLMRARLGHEAVVELLLDRGANADAVDKEGRTPLSWAAAKGQEAVVRLLLDRGANADAVDKEGRTPLSWAAAKGQEAVVRLLLDRGANADAVDKEGRTPLSWAAAKGQEAVVQLLLDRGANAGAMDKEGRRPLARAAVQVLQFHGAQPSTSMSS
ncbi:ankyrin repeat-containing domain protein [Fusarium sp. MPI-SDFR-AT-0072]|nr:ankyrin repeat-containing domain protein [Fusarium sp. MPI-SDFR-AT-0072]